jgi:hypothetical protein
MFKNHLHKYPNKMICGILPEIDRFSKQHSFYMLPTHRNYMLYTP